MRTVEDIYLSKLCQFESIIQEKASKYTGAQSAFAGILTSVQQRIDMYSGASASAATDTEVAASMADVYAADAYTGYIGSAAATGDEIDAAIEDAARSTGLDPDLLRAVIRVESSFDSNAESGAGAQGLMQLMPGTAKELGVTNPFDAAQNVMGGATYLAKQLKRFGDVRLALAAYNTGPGRVNSYGITDANDTSQYERISKGVRGYVSKVLQYYGQYEND
jgi:soluble lytic murein transglycosylase-like protein